MFVFSTELLNFLCLFSVALRHTVVSTKCNKYVITIFNLFIDDKICFPYEVISNILK